MLRGTVVESTFLGNIVDHQVDIDGVLVRVQGDRQQSLRARTQPSIWQFPIAECVAMRGEAD